MTQSRVQSNICFYVNNYIILKFEICAVMSKKLIPSIRFHLSERRGRLNLYSAKLCFEIF